MWEWGPREGCAAVCEGRTSLSGIRVSRAEKADEVVTSDTVTISWLTPILLKWTSMCWRDGTGITLLAACTALTAATIVVN